MARVTFRKHPIDTQVEVGKQLVLSTKTLSATGVKTEWEADLGKGWKVVGKGKTLTIKKAKEAHAGNYRCIINGVCSRVAKVTVGKVAPAPIKDLTPTTEPPLETATKENDGFLEILESTGNDATPEVIQKVTTAIIKKMPDSLKA